MCRQLGTTSGSRYSSRSLRRRPRHVTARCGINGRRLGHFQVWVGTEAGAYTPPGARMCGEHDIGNAWGGTYTIECRGLIGSHVTVLQPGPNRLINLQEVQAFGAPAPQPSPPGLPPAPPNTDGLLLMVPGEVLTLAFGGLTTTIPPTGTTLRSAVLHVSPHSGADGQMTVAVSTAVECAGQLLGQYGDSSNGMYSRTALTPSDAS